MIYAIDLSRMTHSVRLTKGIRSLPAIVTANAIEMCSDLSVFINPIMINPQWLSSTDHSIGDTTSITGLFYKKKSINILQ